MENRIKRNNWQKQDRFIVMIKILIADDSDLKIKNIRKILDNIPEIENYDISVDLISTKKKLKENYYDLFRRQWILYILHIGSSG